MVSDISFLAYVNFEGISNLDIRKIFGLGEKRKRKHLDFLPVLLTETILT